VSRILASSGRNGYQCGGVGDDWEEHLKCTFPTLPYALIPVLPNISERANQPALAFGARLLLLSVAPHAPIFLTIQSLADTHRRHTLTGAARTKGDEGRERV
jgi:hypothetical protein